MALMAASLRQLLAPRDRLVQVSPVEPPGPTELRVEPYQALVRCRS